METTDSTDSTGSVVFVDPAKCRADAQLLAKRAGSVLAFGAMLIKPTLSTLFLCSLAASAQTPKLTLPEFDAAHIGVLEAGGMEMGTGEGSLEITQVALHSMLSKPIKLGESWLFAPIAQYTYTRLGFDGSPASFPFHDEDLQTFGLSAFAVSISESSPWIYGAWGRAELASDFKDVTSDALTFDLAVGGGYRYSDHFILGFGAAVFNLNGHVTGYPGIGFDWIVSDELRVGLYGTSFVTTYACSGDLTFSFRANTGGGIWNVTDASGASRAIDLTSYQMGCYVNRRLAGKLWLTAGVGATVGNKIEYTTPHGDTLFSREPDSGVFGLVALRLKAW